MTHVRQVTNRRVARAAMIFVLALLAGPGSALAADDTALKLANVDGGNTAYVRVPNSAAFSLQTFTLEAWVQRVGAGYGFSTDPSGAAIIAKPREGMSGSNIASWHLHWTPSGEIHFNLTHTLGSSGVYILSSPAVSPLGRHHVAVTFDGAMIRLYVDGVASGSAPWSLGTVYYGADDVLLGADNFDFGYLRRFDGWIDDVRVWDHARTGAEISSAMNCRLTGTESGLVAYWSFDGSNLVDLTGHGHGGAINGVGSSASYGSLVPLSDCVTGVGDRVSIPSSVASMSVFPQPAHDRVTVAFTLPRAGTATLDVVDVAGRRVASLASRAFEAGPHQITTDLAALGAKRPGAGVLFAQLRWEGGTVVRPLVTLK